jgi:hypothetical protein
MTQTRLSHPLDLAQFFEGIQLHVRAKQFCLVSIALVVDVLEGTANNMAWLNAYVGQHYNLTAVIDRTVDKVVFRTQYKEFRQDFMRAGGAVICSACNYEYQQHPMHADGVVNVLCDGRMVKL